METGLLCEKSPEAPAGQPFNPSREKKNCGTEYGVLVSERNPEDQALSVGYPASLCSIVFKVYYKSYWHLAAGLGCMYTYAVGR